MNTFQPNQPSFSDSQSQSGQQPQPAQQPQQTQPVQPWSQPQQPQDDQVKTPSSSDSFVSAMSDSAKAQVDMPAVDQDSQGESLEEQNIFSMLGVSTASNEQRESFLDELQQVIWEDFLEYDVKLLITLEDYDHLQEMLKKPGSDTEQSQEEIVTYLEKKIPDLENIMLEKALELKAEMFKERLTSLRELFSDQPEKIKSLAAAEKLMLEQKWRSAVEAVASL